MPKLSHPLTSLSTEAFARLQFLPGMTHLKVSLLKGNIAEIEFMLKATRLGLIVSKPEIPHDYDFLVDNGNNIFRVQVKSNFCKGPSYKLGIGQGKSSKNAYTPKMIDIMACYLAIARNTLMLSKWERRSASASGCWQ